VEINCYWNNLLVLPRFKKLLADKNVLADLPLVPFVVINLILLTTGVCMKVRFKSKVTKGLSFSPHCYLSYCNIDRCFVALSSRAEKNAEKPLVLG